MNKITVGVVDDHKLFRQGMAGLLNQQDGLSVVLEAANGIELMANLTKLKKRLPDVLLMDVQMPQMDGIEATRYVSAKYPEIKIIILTMHDNDQMIYHLIESGASGFLPKSTDIEIVIDAIFAVHSKGYYINERISAIMLKGVSRKKSTSAFINNTLTEREVEIIKLICSEHPIKEIAEILNVSHRTIEFHKGKILEKIGARNTVGLVIYAMNNNLLELKGLI